MASIVQDIADKHCQGRLAMILEGGYNTESLSRGVHSVLKVLAGETPSEPRACGVEEVEAATTFHKGAFDPEK